jgi:hypothetical protein
MTQRVSNFIGYAAVVTHFIYSEALLFGEREA